METPVRRMTRSQMSGLGPSSAVKPPGRPASSTKKKEIPRLPFADLTNDSPIAGLMPAKMAANSGCVYESTPRSKLRPADRPIGEDLLRMQVTSLLRKVESEAMLQQKSIPCASDLFESPMRLAAPTPVNTPATAPALDTVSQGTNKALAPIMIASPVCHLEVALNLEKNTRVSVATPVLFCPRPVEQTATVSDQQQATTRTLQFDSPEKRAPEVEEHRITILSPIGAPQASPVVTPESVSTAEILISIEEDVQEDQQTTTRSLQFDSPEKHEQDLEAQITTRTLRFESPGKAMSESENLRSLFSPCYNFRHLRGSPGAEDEDSWSVIVNVNSPGKLEAADHPFEETVTTSAEEDVEAMEFVDKVLIEPEQHAELPSVWDRREVPTLENGLKDDDEEYEECEEDDGDYEDYEEYEYGAEEAVDEACEELCKGISHINMGEGSSSTGLPAFQGKHTRFSYNSDEEIEEDVVVHNEISIQDSPGKMKLNGYPTPKGTHLRFNDEEDSDQDV